MAKLFNIVQPTRAYFGQKDGLQCIVVRQLVRELNFPVEIVVCPTSREPDGLAMSSRNIYLSKEQRAVAPRLYQGLQAVERAYSGGSGERSPEALRQVFRESLSGEPLYEMEYISISNGNNGDELQDPIPDDLDVMVSAAIKFSNCRILDNVWLRGP